MDVEKRSREVVWPFVWVRESDEQAMIQAIAALVREAVAEENKICAEDLECSAKGIAFRVGWAECLNNNQADAVSQWLIEKAAAIRARNSSKQGGKGHDTTTKKSG